MPINGNKLYCGACTLEQPQINLVRCKRCGSDLGAPNVNEVSIQDEIKALEVRYDEARKNIIEKNSDDAALISFEHYFVSNVKGIINIDFSPLAIWLLSDDETYKNYYRLTNDGIRAIAIPENDRKRNIVDSFLFGSYAREMIFAALSLSNKGLKSYGDCSVTLDEHTIAHRATVIEENSYKFAEQHNINFERVTLPQGYRATWANKMQLAVAKLHRQINTTATIEDYCNLVLFSEGNRATDEFMEIHIYKELSEYSVKDIFMPLPNDRKASFDLKRMKEKYPDRVFIVN